MANSGGVYTWSRTATTNATADSTVNYAEGQTPSSLNDSARNAMASVAKYRDDITGAIVTTGTSSAYIVGSYQVFDTLAHMDGQVIAFTPHATNGTSPTLNVDSLGAKNIVSSTGAQIQSGTLIQGTPYVALYNNTSGEWRLQNFFGSPFSIPIGAMIPYSSSQLPNSSFVFPYGQAISRSVYSTLYALTGGAYGAGDGSTTFNLPDIRGRVIAGLDNMGGTIASRLTTTFSGVDGTTYGATGGSENITLSANQLPTITATGSGSASVTSSNSDVLRGPATTTTGLSAGGNSLPVFPTGTSATSQQIASTGSVSVTTTSNNTGGLGHVNVQPTIVLPYIMRVI